MIPFKVCCMKSVEEADMAIEAGAQAVGLVGHMPNGPGILPDEKIKEIADQVHARHQNRIWTTLLTSEIQTSSIIDHVRVTAVNTLQIVDWPEEGSWSALRSAYPTLRLIQVIHVEDRTAIDLARIAAPHVDYLLLDSGKPSAATRTLGGTGDTHDWSVSADLVREIETPVFLAGGLDPENVRIAIEEVRPYGVDICSGLRNRENDYDLIDSKLLSFANALNH